MLLKPNVKLDRITDITYEMLEKRGINALILDVDNTLSTHHGMKLCDGLEDWLALMKSKGIKLLVLSNSTKKRVEPFAEKIGLDFISLGLKPLFTGYIRSLKRLKTKRKNTAIVGDQIFTDVWGAKRAGIKSYMVKYIDPHEEIQIILKRRLEYFVLKEYRKRLKKSIEKRSDLV